MSSPCNSSSSSACVIKFSYTYNPGIGSQVGRTVGSLKVCVSVFLLPKNDDDDKSCGRADRADDDATREEESEEVVFITAFSSPPSFPRQFAACDSRVCHGKAAPHNGHRPKRLPERGGWRLLRGRFFEEDAAAVAAGPSPKKEVNRF